MIPFVAVVSLRNQQSQTFRLWIPLFLIWLIVFPLAVFLSPFVFLACCFCRMSPFLGVSLMWQILTALTDTRLAVERPSAGMSFHIL
jgi:uncharacterized membrane protein